MGEDLKRSSKCKIENLFINFHKDKKTKMVCINNASFVGRNTIIKI